MIKQKLIEAFRNATKKVKIKYGIASIIYILFVIWLRNPVWLAGLFVIFDLYFTKWVKWAFWKKRYKQGEKRNSLLEWLDALIFALIVATIVRLFFLEAYVIPTSSMEKSLLVGDYLFVSKVAYGPKVPNTPLSIPLVHNQITLLGSSFESYSELIKLPYKRLAGLGKIKRNDVVVFNFPNGDTIIKDHPEIIDYYQIKRNIGEQNFNEWLKRNRYELVARPIDKKDHYVKRCVAIPGDSLQVKQSQLYINGEPAKDFPGQEYSYTIVLKEQLSDKALAQLGLSMEDLRNAGKNQSVRGYSNLVLTQKAYETLKSSSSVVSIIKNESYGDDCFPFSERYPWTIDNFGPLKIPQKGATINIDTANICLYQRIIQAYEGNSLTIKDGKIYINDSQTSTYTFKMDYYFMMGDNRHGSYDSRAWGFVPEDHVVGRPSFIWFSSDKDKSFPMNIRWKRMFNSIK
ncbi:MAG: S26 family signal peptidase [Prevotellaceae bacterium]|jgi:signal peptidase I|nr:S26 family signal peptidase [Prevotellaceae bacterium]